MKDALKKCLKSESNLNKNKSTLLDLFQKNAKNDTESIKYTEILFTKLLKVFSKDVKSKGEKKFCMLTVIF